MQFVVTFPVPRINNIHSHISGMTCAAGSFELVRPGSGCCLVLKWITLCKV